MSQSLKEKSIRAFKWDIFGKFIAQSISILATIILTRILLPEDFGLIAMVMIIISLAQVLSDVGLSSALIQREKVSSIHYNSVFWFYIFIGCILTICVFYSAHLVSSFYNIPEIEKITQAISIIFLINALGATQSARLKKKLLHHVLVKNTIFSTVISSVIGVALAMKGAGVWSLVVQVLIQRMLFNISLFISSQWQPKFQFSLRSLLDLWGFGFRMFLSSIIDTIFTRIDMVVIGYIFSTAQLGFYERAKQLNMLFIRLPANSLGSVVFPTLTKLQNDTIVFQQAITKSLNILSLLNFLGVVCLYLIAEDLVLFLFTEKWLPSIAYLKLIILSSSCYAFNALLVNVLSSRGNSKAYLQLEIIKKCFLVLNLINLILFGINSFLWGLIIISYITFFLNCVYASKELSIELAAFVRPVLGQMVISLTSAFIAYYITLGINFQENILNTATQLSIFVAINLVVNFFLKTSAFQETVKQITKKESTWHS